MTSDPSLELKRAVQAGWDEMAPQYHRRVRISTRDLHYGPLCPGEREYRLLGDVAGLRVLELACGAAQNAIALARWGARVTALDFSQRQLEEARRLVRREGVAVDLLRADAETLACIRDRSFDLVLSSFGWEFIPDLELCFRHCRRVLKPQGRLLVCTTHPLGAFQWDAVMKALLVTDYFNPPVEVWDDLKGPVARRGITFFRTFQEMFDLLRGAGFRVERVVEPAPLDHRNMSPQERAERLPYAGPYWEEHFDRLRRIPFAIVYVARAVEGLDAPPHHQ